MKFFAVSDLHLFHTNIIKYANRSEYKMTDDDAIKMTYDIVNYINEKIPDETGVVLWNLGDLFYGSLLNKYSILDLQNLILIMRGKHRKLQLILGNHDKEFRHLDWMKPPTNWWLNKYTTEHIFREFGFSDVYFFPIIIGNLILSHEPVWLPPNSPYLNIHGHTHQTFVDETYFTWKYQNHEIIKKAYLDSNKDVPEDFDEQIQEPESMIVNPSNYFNASWDAHNSHIVEIDLNFSSSIGSLRSCDVKYFKDESKSAD